MRHLFNALKEHWQIYVGLLLGLIIGLLVGVGFADWKSLVKGLDSKVTDWVSSISAFLGMIFTGGILFISAKVAKSWKEQKTPDAKSAIVENLITYDSIVNHLMVEFNHTDNTIRYEKILTTYISLFNQLSIIESSIIKFYFFDSTEKKEIDNLYLNLRDSLNSFAKEISKYLNINIQGKSIPFDPDITKKTILPFNIMHKLRFDKVLSESLSASFKLLSQIAGENLVITHKDNQ
ncbi:TPA: hypothetical protein ACPO38_000094 [Haemophilus influenzae]